MWHIFYSNQPICGHFILRKMNLNFNQIQIFSIIINCLKKVRRNLSISVPNQVPTYVAHTTNFKLFVPYLSTLKYLHAISKQSFWLIHSHWLTFKLPKDLFFYFYLCRWFFYLNFHYLSSFILIRFRIFYFLKLDFKNH